jgi:hypothetical protein
MVTTAVRQAVAKARLVVVLNSMTILYRSVASDSKRPKGVPVPCK